MRFPELVTGRLIQRYKRFLADIALDGGGTITAHCANPGSMIGLVSPGGRVWLSRSDKPGRKLPYSWELVEARFGDAAEIIGINTGHPNLLVEEAIRGGALAGLAGYATLSREVRYGRNSRIDILLRDPGRPPCYVEVKNVHMMREHGLAEFPDCVTARGAKHLEELGDQVEAGNRAVMVYLIQMRATAFRVAADFDPAYALAFARARARGVEAVAYACRVNPEAIVVDREVPVLG